MQKVIRWGILGTGRIAHKFVAGLLSLPDARITAVGSRTQMRAEEFGSQYGIPKRHASYEELAVDDEVDVVYVSTPHSCHKRDTLLCLEANKAVLCEKPFAVNAQEAEVMVRTARARNLFLMEAMWTRFLPVTTELRNLLRLRTIGEVRMLQADFGFHAQFDPEGRLFNPMLGGGSLLDVGVYTVSLASMVFGTHPSVIRSVASLGKTGVDEQMATVFTYPDGGIAMLASAIRVQTVQRAVILGTKGRITLEPPFWRGTSMTLKVGEEEKQLRFPYEGNGYNLEAAEVARCLREGKTESEIMPLDESLAVMRTMDVMRSQWGLVYPMEESERRETREAVSSVST